MKKTVIVYASKHHGNTLKLVNAISKEMGMAEEENREYILTDLQNLEIEGSTVSVIIGENIAIVAVDGYTFYIDSNFVLTTE